ncbi:hypothetical protein [Deinococcus radiotolerans]|uniref:GAF domain-containing protein n=1 Tax=Deinococcus radiotolerans TaxID=1309407 RepID=A0ABQ2FQ45_9DEIO|nr:hypothetical protein [Deinococcus radiotolerans]GGL15792.1 hypothetical protein GCM10010844_38390 [Deinococcus radiotolerans]
MTALMHQRQAHLYGCLYHALHAITQDHGWLAHVEDISENRWLARIHDEGGMIRTYYADAITGTPVPPDFWGRLRAAIPPGGEGGAPTTHLPLLVTVDGLSGLGFHVVALCLPMGSRDDVIISDSARSELLTLTWDDFLGSAYAQATQVQQLITNDLHRYPHESGAEYVSRQDPAPYTM